MSGRMSSAAHGRSTAILRRNEEHVCDSSGEDPTCKDSLRADQLRHLDHGTYFNMSSECNPMYTPTNRTAAAHEPLPARA